MAGMAGIGSVYSDLTLAAQQNQQQLQQQQDLLKKKKLMQAGAQNGMMTAAQTLYGSRTLGSATVPM